MATAIQFRRGTTAQHSSFTGLVGAWMDSVPGIIISGNEKSIFTSKKNKNKRKVKNN